MADSSASLCPVPSSGWPLFEIALSVGEVRLRTVRDDDLDTLLEILPGDFEQDPAAELLAGQTAGENRRRLFVQGIWRNRGTWSPHSWCLDLLVEHRGRAVGLQSLEGDHFPLLRTVDTGSWLHPAARRQGIGIAMRTAVLGLAFGPLGARAAISSARRDNVASLGVSRSIGYLDNGISATNSPTGVVELQHLRMTEHQWNDAGRGPSVDINGLAGLLPLFGIDDR